MTDEELILRMKQALEKLPSAMVAVAFSGGLDSSILAKLLEGRCRLYIVGTPDSQDMQEGVTLADSHGWDVLPIMLDIVVLKEIMPHIVPLLSSPMPMTFNFNVPIFLSAQSACEMTLVTGSGADELFGGYNRYSRMNDKEFEHASKNDLDDLLCGDLVDSQTIVASTGHVLNTPYLSDAVVEHALTLPCHLRRDKTVLRGIARELGLEVHDRKKKAAQFGSGAARLLRNMAREAGCSEQELILMHRIPR